MNPWSTIPLLSCVVYSILLIVTLLRGKARPYKPFTLFLLASLFWSMSSFMVTHDHAASTKYLVFWNNMVLLGAVWSMVAYYHFVRHFTNRSTGIITYLGYTFLFIMLGLSFGSHVVRDASLVDGYLHHDLGPWIGIMMATLIPLISITMVMLIQQYRRSKYLIDRNRIAYLMVGAGIVFVYSPINASIPTLAGLPTDHLGTLANALIIGFVISKYQLLDIRFVARGTIAYLLLTLILIGTYVGVMYLEITLLPQISIPLILLTSIILSALLALLFQPLRYLLQDRVGRLFHGDIYVHRQALLDFNNKIAATIKLDEAADEMLYSISKALRLTHADILFEDNENGDFLTYFTYPKTRIESDKKLRFTRDNPVVAWLAKEDKPLLLADSDNIPELRNLKKVSENELSDPRLALLMPIRSRDKMIGILALGHRQSGYSYHIEDVQLVITMAKQGSVVMENALLYTQAKERANLDELTGLFNHRNFHQRLDEQIERASRFGEIFSLLLIDLDSFKSYNDINGHLYGDKVLQSIGARIKSVVRTIDLAFRYGGDEFAIILPQTAGDGAYNVAERIRTTLDSRLDHKGMPVTCSIGIATWPTDGVMREETLRAADLALYYAKQIGKNRVCFASEVSVTDDGHIDTATDINTMILNTIYALAATVDAKDHYTYGHSKKVSSYAVDIARALGFSEERIKTVHTAALLHDIGKIGVSDQILIKPGSLDEDEWKPIHAHPTMGVSILKHVDSLKDCLAAVQYHHERYDGNGYPAGLKGNNIPLDARILAVADSFDAMTSSRPYRNTTMTTQQALEELIRCAGTQFDPEIVKVFVGLMTVRPSRKVGINEKNR